jgi:hypothetical protein
MVPFETLVQMRGTAEPPDVEVLGTFGLRTSDLVGSWRVSPHATK